MLLGDTFWEKRKLGPCWVCAGTSEVCHGDVIYEPEKGPLFSERNECVCVYIETDVTASFGL